MRKFCFINKSKAIILTTALLLSCLSVYGCAPGNNTNTDTPTDSTISATTPTNEADSTQPATEADKNKATTEATTEATTQQSANNAGSSSNGDTFQTYTTTTQSVPTQNEATQNNTSQNTVTPTTPTQPATTTDKNGLKLVEQTFVDAETGISVSGMLPEGADMYIRFTSKEFMRMSDNFELTIKSEISNPTVAELKAYKPAYNPIKFYSSTDWSLSTEPMEADGVPCIEVYFAKGDELLNFESEFTITAPIDFRTFASSRKSDFHMNAVYFDNEKCNFFTTSVISTEETKSNCFAFKAYTPGKYCFGNLEFMNKYLGYYNLSLSQLRPYAERNNY